MLDGGTNCPHIVGLAQGWCNAPVGVNPNATWENAGNMALDVGEFFFGARSILNDVQTIMNPNQSLQNKVGAVGNAVLNVGLDLLHVGPIADAAVHAVADVARPVVKAVQTGVDVLCGGLSFSSDTLVATSDGEKTLGSLKIGDQVRAFDPETKKVSTQTIQQVFVNHDTDLIDVTLSRDPMAKPTTAAVASSKQQSAAGASHGSHAPPSEQETIHTTQKHPWLTASDGWVTAGHLHVGEHVLRLDGTTATVVALKVIPGQQDMYDLTVSNVHTFAVGLQQFVVHNCPSFPNKYVPRLAGEMSDANRLGVQTMSAGDPALKNAIQAAPNGELTIKWAVNTNNELGIIQHSVPDPLTGGMTEIHHPVIFNGADDLSAGEGVLKLDNAGNIVADYLDNTSGHYVPGNLAQWDAAYNTSGIPAFQNAGILGADQFSY